LRRGERHEARTLSGARAVLDRDARNLGGAAAGRGGDQFPRHLAGAGDANRAVLSPRLLAGVRAVAGAVRAGRHGPVVIRSALVAGQRQRGSAMAKTPYDTDLDRNPANFQPLTPLSLLDRAAAVYPDHTAIIHGKLRRSYAEFYARA